MEQEKNEAQNCYCISQRLLCAYVRLRSCAIGDSGPETSSGDVNLVSSCYDEHTSHESASNSSPNLLPLHQQGFQKKTQANDFEDISEIIKALTTLKDERILENQLCSSSRS
ncbi:Uncharacterized protein Rs2_32269 [Raphanus sativus]|nr:Uncharacterized protein Rs2_32269 [Raphanus sativus]